jgi:hypothetical protein
LRAGKSKAIVAIPPVVRLVIVRVQPSIVIIAIRIEQPRIAVRIAQNIILTTAQEILPRAESYPASVMP